MDLGQYVRGFGGTTYMGELNDPNGLLDKRGIAPGAARPLEFDAVRQAYWEAGPRRYGDFQLPAFALPVDDETNLRYRMATHDLTEITSVMEGAMFDFMRLNVVPGADLNSNADATGHYTYTAATRETPRLRMTTQSAEAIFAPTLPGETPLTRVLQYGLNDPIFEIDPATATAARKADLATALGEVSTVVQRVYDAGNPPTVKPDGRHLGSAGQPVCRGALQDYRDVDNRLTAVGTGADERYGMEALPFIGEVYVQRPYARRPGSTPSTNFDVTWRRQRPGRPTADARLRHRNP